MTANSENVNYEKTSSPTTVSPIENTELCAFQQSETFYKNAQTYWSTIEPTVDGMLGGFSTISGIDIQGSSQFLKEIFKMKPSPNCERALDCGAGIGRVSKHLLMPLFKTVDLVEQDKVFADKVNDYLNVQTQSIRKLGTVYQMGLQDFTPDAGKYDVIWCQWVLGHLRDQDFVTFFKRCADGLAANGVIVLKENVTATEDVCIDDVDSSVTRSLKDTKSLLTMAGLRIIKMIRQTNFIQGLFPVFIIACRPLRKTA